MKNLIPFIYAAGALHLLIASANFFLPKKLRYAENLAKVAPIIRQVFIIHSIYIVMMLVFFAALCFAFAPELAGDSRLGTFLSAFLALFWLPRVGIQLFYYDASLKRQNRLAHFVFVAIFIYLAAVFSIAALKGVL
jgi:hypothetical protein